MSTPIPSLDFIPAFVAVMDTGSLSGAARRLRLSQPTVRRQIEALETALGTPLFTRASNGLIPVEMAHDLLVRARAVLDEAAAFARSASAAQGATQGTVRLTAPRVIAAQVLPPVLASLRGTFPEITIELAATDVAENLLQRAADIAIRVAPVTQKALVVRHLPDIELGFFASKDRPELDRPAKVDDLTNLPFISDDRAAEMEAGLQKQGWPTPHNIVLRTDDGLAQIGAIASGLGIGVCQAGIARRLGLKRVLPELQAQLPCSVVMHEDQRHVPRIRGVFDHLVQHLPTALAGQD